jgi:hypothetical protein
MSELKLNQKKTCKGCRALSNTSNKCDFGLPTDDIQDVRGSHYPMLPKIIPLGQCYKPKTLGDYDLAQKLSRDIH